MPDVIDKMFGEVGEFYPGSKKKRRPKSGEQKKVNNEKELWQEKPQIKKLPNGKVVELYSVGALSVALGRPLVTLRLWERKGYIPRAPYRLRSVGVGEKKRPGNRMYSRAIIESTIKSFQSRGLLEAPRIDWNRFPDLSIELLENWTEIHKKETTNDQ